MTHKQRVLELLSDMKPHSHRAGYRLGVMLHSRVSDLRTDGHEIRCWRDGDDYFYQLIRRPLEEASSPDLASSSGLESVALERGSAAGLGPLEQLTLDVPRGAYEVAA